MGRKNDTWQKFFTNRNESTGTVQAGATALPVVTTPIIAKDTYTTTKTKHQWYLCRALCKCFLTSRVSTTTATTTRQ